MRLVIKKEEISDILQSVVNIIPPRTTLPILQNFLIEAHKNELRFSATDLDIFFSSSIQTEVKEEGSITVPARKFVDIIRELPEIPIYMRVDEDVIAIECEKSFFRLTGISREEYPEVPELSEASVIKIDGATLLRLINKTSFAISTDETRPALCGLLWQISGEEMTVVTTDGHRLSFLRKLNMPRREKKEVIIPPKVLNLLTRLISPEIEIEVRFEEGRIGFYFNNTVVISRLIDAAYPDYNTVIPKDNDKIVKVNKDKFTSAIRRVSLFSDIHTHLIKLSLKENLIKLFSSSTESGEASDEVICSYKGEEMEIGYNANYLLGVLKCIESDDVVCQLKSSDKAGIMISTSQREDEELLYLLMPIRLS